MAGNLDSRSDYTSPFDSISHGFADALFPFATSDQPVTISEFETPYRLWTLRIQPPLPNFGSRRNRIGLLYGQSWDTRPYLYRRTTVSTGAVTEESGRGRSYVAGAYWDF